MAAPPNRLFVSVLSRTHVFWYRLLGGAGPVGRFGKAPVLLLTTAGRKTGRSRTTPLIYGRDGDDLVVVASYGGSDQDPGWWRNLKAHPDAVVQVGREVRNVRAEQAGPEDKARLWSMMAKLYATYDDYQNRTSRLIPVVLLKPAP